MHAPELQFAVTYQNLSTFALEYERQISTNGVYLKTAKPIQLGKQVGVHFRFKDTQETLFAVGTVAWVDPNKDPQSGRSTFLVRDLHLNAESQAILNGAQGGGGVAEAAPAYQPPPPPVPTAPPPPQAAPTMHTQPPAPMPHAPAPTAPHASPATSAAKTSTGDGKKKAVFLIGGLSFIGILVAVWLLLLGGMQVVMTRFLPPPKRIAAAPAEALPAPAEPPLTVKKAPPAPPKPVIRTANLKEFEYYQGPTYNRFVLIFDRPPTSVNGSATSDSYALYLGRTKIKLEKPQVFLPFTWVKSVFFEEVQDTTRVSFMANASYLPEPEIDQEGRTVTISFIPRD